MMEYLRYITAVDGDLSVMTDGAQKRVLLLANNWVTLLTLHIAIITVLPMLSGSIM